MNRAEALARDRPGLEFLFYHTEAQFPHVYNVALCSLSEICQWSANAYCLSKMVTLMNCRAFFPENSPKIVIVSFKVKMKKSCIYVKEQNWRAGRRISLEWCLLTWVTGCSRRYHSLPSSNQVWKLPVSGPRVLLLTVINKFYLGNTW